MSGLGWLVAGVAVAAAAAVWLAAGVVALTGASCATEPLDVYQHMEGR